MAAPASPATAAAAAPASAASAARPHTFSSLQQLLALKNRVLMDLQRHGFGSPGGRETAGKPVGASGAASGAVAQAPGSAQGSATAHGLAARAAGANERFIGIGGYGVTLARDAVATVAAIAAAAVAALLVVVAGLAVGRRKRRAARAAAADEALQANASSPPVRDEAQPGRASAPPPVTDDPVEAEFLATLARTPTSKRALMGLAAHYAERRNARGFDEIAQRIWRLSGGRGPNWIHIAALGRQLDPDNALYAVSGTDAADTFVGLEPDDDDVLPAHSTAAQQQAAAQPAEPVVERRPAEAEPPVAAAPETPVEPASVQPEHGAPEQPEASAVESEPLIQPESVEPGEAQAAHIEASEAEPEPAASAREEPIEPAPVPPASARAEEALAEEAPHERPTQPAMPFPPEAIAALNALDLGLPPRSESPAPGQAAPEAAHPAGEPEELEQTDDFAERERRLAPQEPAVEAAPAEQAGPAEPVEPAAPVPPAQPAVAGLGAAPFGALDLAFDLDLPGAGEDGGERRASPAPAQPMFTPEQMARIARNKLELASEYIALGDLGGARTLIHEVIESNDPATHDEAKALLATLAPLS
ncbi:hypothetical protein Busp01_21170 [Trinickia caryophylli]|uniref:FimV C-terminal domain-containing protein n=1 Tax=Trinickia caryophylli TaxID=28094 RepID=A0A1X7EH15_TRICW|nr:hypothetical protein Busp01_21170 [Trinickia caryophylli]SMF33777.1 FimV C-terminal domain-containing protein [Trinickia caryophylli]